MPEKKALPTSLSGKFKLRGKHEAGKFLFKQKRYDLQTISADKLAELVKQGLDIVEPVTDKTDKGK